MHVYRATGHTRRTQKRRNGERKIHKEASQSSGQAETIAYLQLTVIMSYLALGHHALVKLARIVTGLRKADRVRELTRFPLPGAACRHRQRPPPEGGCSRSRRMRRQTQSRRRCLCAQPCRRCRRDGVHDAAMPGRAPRQNSEPQPAARARGAARVSMQRRHAQGARQQTASCCPPGSRAPHARASGVLQGYLGTLRRSISADQ